MARRNDIFSPQEENRGFVWVILIVALLGALTAAGLFMNKASNQRVTLSTEKVSVMNLPKVYEGFTILHLSDLHASSVGSDPSLWRQLLYGKSYHAIVLSGDMVGATGNDEPFLSLLRALQQVKADIPIYFIAGDEDPTPVQTQPHGTPDVLAEWVLAAQRAGAIYLDAPVAQTVGKQTVWFVPQYLYDMDPENLIISLTAQIAEMEAAGQQYEAENGAVYRALKYRLDAMTRTQEAIKLMKDSDLQIAVNHPPLDNDYIRTSLEWADQSKVFNFREIDLLLCGDLCGGQWRLPGIGPVYIPERGFFPGDDGVSGLQRINSINQHVSPGLGASKLNPLPGRLMNPPGAALIRFTGTIQ
ncbi:MAG: metallophosphoesterase [Clostridia bacterium]|nr:metallophosphoesterase [Clostridia bacterium]